MSCSQFSGIKPKGHDSYKEAVVCSIKFTHPYKEAVVEVALLVQTLTVGRNQV